MESLTLLNCHNSKQRRDVHLLGEGTHRSAKGVAAKPVENLLGSVRKENCTQWHVQNQRIDVVGSFE
jgi:hypothetical protein